MRGMSISTRAVDCINLRFLTTWRQPFSTEGLFIAYLSYVVLFNFSQPLFFLWHAAESERLYFFCGTFLHFSNSFFLQTTHITFLIYITYVYIIWHLSQCTVETMKTIMQSCVILQVPKEWMKTMKIIHPRKSEAIIMCSIMHCPGNGYQR